jgi:nucleoside-triphosphatase THEP1
VLLLHTSSPYNFTHCFYPLYPTAEVLPVFYEKVGLTGIKRKLCSMIKNFIITGRPGTGKSTLLKNVIREAKKNHVAVGGISTPENRGPSGRTGFFLIDLQTGTKHVMASILPQGPPRIGRYHVHLDTVEIHGANAIQNAIQNCQLICIDEIGKMELLSPRFTTSVRAALDSPIQVLGTLGYNIHHPLTQELPTRSDTQILVLTKQNRNELQRKILTIMQLKE